MIDIRFTSLTSFGADPGMKELLEDAGMQSTTLADANTIIFNGGADIATSIYGEAPISKYIPEFPSPRDLQEMQIFRTFSDPTTLKVGICRGAQLLNCLNGGKLWQDVGDHGSSHEMLVIGTQEKIWVTSTHHQMMRPGPDGIVLGVADVATRKRAANANYPEFKYDDNHLDTEIVWYPATSTLCIQGHPEYIPGSRFAEFSIDLIRQYWKEAQRVEQTA